MMLIICFLFIFLSFLMLTFTVVSGEVESEMEIKDEIVKIQHKNMTIKV
ncbi:CLUMA_CG002019, isoform A, partial [Clunio marinus]